MHKAIIIPLITFFITIFSPYNLYSESIKKRKAITQLGINLGILYSPYHSADIQNDVNYPFGINFDLKLSSNTMLSLEFFYFPLYEDNIEINLLIKQYINPSWGFLGIGIIYEKDNLLNEFGYGMKIIPTGENIYINKTLGLSGYIFFGLIKNNTEKRIDIGYILSFDYIIKE
jgi:hypothetical protein